MSSYSDSVYIRCSDYTCVLVLQCSHECQGRYTQDARLTDMPEVHLTVMFAYFRRLSVLITLQVSDIWFDLFGCFFCDINLGLFVVLLIWAPVISINFGLYLPLWLLMMI